MTATARQPVPRPRPECVPPRADCTADSAGGLTFDIALPGAGDRWDAALLLRRASDEEPVRLPLVPAGEGVLRAVLPSTMPLSEGRWKASVALGDEPPVRLLPGRHDLRSLIARVPRTGRTWLGVRIPYRTQHGNLSLRSWLRWPHAEAAEVRVDEGVLRIRGRLHGAPLGAGARLEARPDGAERPAAVAEAVREGPEFTVRLPLRPLAGPGASGAGGAAAAGGWSLWLRPAEGVPAVRLARILDDIADKRHSVRYPAVPLPGGAALRPGYTGDNDLVVRHEPQPAAGLRTDHP